MFTTIYRTVFIMTGETPWSCELNVWMWIIRLHQVDDVDVDVSVEAMLIFIEPGRRWAHSPSSSKAPGIPYQDATKTSVRMLNTSGGL